MERLFSLFGMSALVGTIVLLPMTTHAYLTPDQVFGGSSGVHGAAGDNLQPPPTQREGEAAVAVQQQQALEQRLQAQQALVRVDAPPVAPSVSPSSPESKGLFDQNAQYELRKQRIDEQRTQAPTIIIGGGTEVRDGNGNVLHSGAPNVSSTGPASVLGVLAMLLAAACTFAYSNYRSRTLPVAI